MILVIVGTQDMPFDRLLNQVFDYAVNDNCFEEIIVQRGCSKLNIRKENVKVYDYLTNIEMQALMKDARLVISHAGVGVIMEVLKHKKPLIVIPRLKKFNEHHNDHQLEIANSFSNKNYLICSDSINEALNKIETFNFESYPFGGIQIQTYLKKLIEGQVD